MNPSLFLHANFGSLFGLDGFVILILGLLIFGRGLPQVGRNLSHAFATFRGKNSRINPLEVMLFQLIVLVLIIWLVAGVLRALINR